MSKNVHVQYYAALREQRGESSETLATAAATAEELYAELQTRHQFSLELTQLKVAVNAAFAPWDTQIKDGDTVVFVPPVAGG
jgi:molybdopterin converting factor subunit 1